MSKNYLATPGNDNFSGKWPHLENGDSVGVISGEDAIGDSAGLEGRKSSSLFGLGGLEMGVVTGGGGGRAMIFKEGSGCNGAVEEVVDIRECGGEGDVTRTELNK